LLIGGRHLARGESFARELNPPTKGTHLATDTRRRSRETFASSASNF
jgi:hypothetical protein